MTDLRFFFFDLGNVLVRFEHATAHRQIAQVTGTEPDAVKRLVFDSGLEHRYEQGELTCAEFHQACAELLGPCDQEPLLHALSDIFELDEQASSIVRRLRDGGRRTGVLSNTCAAHWRHCWRRYDFLERDFDVYALSFEIRSMKPAPAVYARAAELAGESPERIFFVDDRKENVDAAAESGMDAVRFQNAEQLARELTARGAF